MSLDSLLDRLTTLHPKVIDLSLERVLRLLERLGSPHLTLPSVVHVAGTNGKGSTVAFLRSMAEAAGKRAHVYTSPHLVRFNERIRIAGNIIRDDALLSVLEEVEQVNNGAPATFFEVTTCAAFLAFARVPADLVLLETGLGGRLDATNVIPSPALTILTPIDYDHQGYLGETLTDIAGEKAAILKPGVPCVSAAQAVEARTVIEARAGETGGALYVQGRDFHSERDGAGLRFTWNGQTRHYPLPGLPGPYQIENAGNALAAAALLGIGSEACVQGLECVEWPARLHRLVRGPLVEPLPEGWELWLDGGHNPHAAKALAGFLPEWRDCPLDLVVGMIETKDEAGFLSVLAPCAERLCTVPVRQSQVGRDPYQLAGVARSVGFGVVNACDSVGDAVRTLVQDRRDSGDRSGRRRILIVGSLYLAGEVLAGNS